MEMSSWMFQDRKGDACVSSAVWLALWLRGGYGSSSGKETTVWLRKSRKLHQVANVGAELMRQARKMSKNYEKKKNNSGRKKMGWWEGINCRQAELAVWAKVRSWVWSPLRGDGASEEGRWQFEWDFESQATLHGLHDVGQQVSNRTLQEPEVLFYRYSAK